MPRRRRTTWDRLYDVMERLLPRIVIVHLSACSESAWSCEIKLITHSNPGRSDMGVTLYKAAGGTGEEALSWCLDDFEELLTSEAFVKEAIASARAELEEA